MFVSCFAIALIMRPILLVNNFVVVFFFYLFFVSSLQQYQSAFACCVALVYHRPDCESSFLCISTDTGWPLGPTAICDGDGFIDD